MHMRFRFMVLLAAITFFCRIVSCAEPLLHCQWQNPNTKLALSLTFTDNPMLVVLPGEAITLTATCQGLPGQVTILKDGRPIRTSDTIHLSAPSGAGSYFIPVVLEGGGMRRESEICVLVPFKGTARRVDKGLEVVVDNDNIGFYRAPAHSGNVKVRNNPDCYQPPAWWLRVTDMNAAFSVVPGLKADELVAVTEDTGRKHTELVPVNYPMWQTIQTLRSALDSRGIPGSALKLISMFRTPPYNRGVGSNAYGRHIFGDAFDFYIDCENDGKATDLNRDGKRDRRDAYIIVSIIEDLQADGRIPMGGIGVYNTIGGDHEVTMHLDMRGHRATWGFLYSASGKKSEFSWASKRFAELDRHEEGLAAERATREGRRYSRPNREALP